METHFLLITNAGETTWLTAFEQTLSRLGDLRVTTEKEATETFSKWSYELVIIDSATVEEPLSLAQKLQSRKPDTRIAVMTTVPTWREARDILRAGIVDYFPRTLPSQELFITIKTMLQEKVDNEPDNDSISG